MKPIIATIRPEIEANPRLHEAVDRLTQLEIHCDAKDFGRPAPLLANLFELVAGRPFEAGPSARIRFESADHVVPDGPRLPVLWLRIDTARGDLGGISGRRISLAERLDALSNEVAGLLASGRALLVLDCSHRGEFPFPAEDMVRIAARYGIPMANIAVLNPHAAPLDAAPVHDEADATLLGASAGILQLWRLLFGVRVRGDEFRAPFGFAAAGPRNRRFHYICVNREASALRATLVARLLERPERGLISFPKDRFQRNMPGSEPFRTEIDQISLYHERGDNHARVEAFLTTKTSLVIEPPSNPAARWGFDLMPAEALKQSMLQVLCEPQMGGPEPGGLSEPALKAIVAGLPFVLFGAQGAVERLREAGFDVLDDIVDHTYDGEADPAARFAGAYETLENFLAFQGRPPAMTVAEQDRLVQAAAHNRLVFEGPLMERWFARPIDRLYHRHPLVRATHAAQTGLDGLAPYIPSFVHAHH